MNVYLTGMMGCGKSSIGKQIAKRRGCRFVDLDAEIERLAGMRIPAIFEQRGEDGFRDLETAALREIAQDFEGLVACGGGVILREENVRIMKGSGKIVYIRRPIEMILRDVKTTHRPLLAQGKEKAAQIFAQRKPLYETYADAVLDNEGSFLEVLRRMDRLLNTYKPGQP